MKMKDSNLVKVVNPKDKSGYKPEGPAGVVGAEHQLPPKFVLERAANAIRQIENTAHQGGQAHNAWVNYRQSVTRVREIQPMGARFHAAPPALQVVPLSRREKRPSLSYVRMRSPAHCELVTHVLANGELQEPKIKKFSSVEAAYEELMLSVVARREQDVKIMTAYKAEQADQNE